MWYSISMAKSGWDKFDHIPIAIFAGVIKCHIRSDQSKCIRLHRF